MKPTSDAVRFLDEDTVERTVALIRRDPLLGRGTLSTWELVTPSDWEAGERVRALVEEGVVLIAGAATPETILEALREAEPAWWVTGELS